MRSCSCAGRLRSRSCSSGVSLARSRSLCSRASRAIFSCSAMKVSSTFTARSGSTMSNSRAWVRKGTRLHRTGGIPVPPSIPGRFNLGRRPSGVQRSMIAGSLAARPADNVASLYQRLWNARPPRATGEQRVAADAQAHAAAQGWLPPLAWDDIDTDPTPSELTSGLPRWNDIDEIAVERALVGDYISYGDLTPVEQHEVVRRLILQRQLWRCLSAGSVVSG